MFALFNDHVNFYSIICETSILQSTAILNEILNGVLAAQAHVEKNHYLSNTQRSDEYYDLFLNE